MVETSSLKTTMKKVLLIIVDALASRVVGPALAHGRLPNLRALTASGYVDWNCTAIFPSITPAATAALITGGYPCVTDITGAYFYDRKDSRVHYYGDDTGPILRRGFATFLEDFLIRLNRDQLRAETAFETVERHAMRAACLNFLWFRGSVEHRVQMPLALRLWAWSGGSKKIMGPSILSLGDFVSSRVGSAGSQRLKGPGGLFRRFGFNDAATAAELLILARQRSFPEFTVAYFPDNDFESHSDGAEAALGTIVEFDRTLGELADAYGGLQKLLESLAIVITGDHGQSDLPMDQHRTGIRLDESLNDYKLVAAGENWGEGDELMICPNMRAAQIYLRGDYVQQRKKIAERLLEDQRIDQIMWRSSDPGNENRYCVGTHRHGTFEFWPATQGPHSAIDEYGTRWDWQGDLTNVDARVTADGTIEFGTNPNALERIATAFDHEVSGDLWLTSRLGYEFCTGDTSIHRRGSHGSLHSHDSLSPLILAGVPESFYPTKTARSVDVAPLCLSLLGLDGVRQVGASHIDMCKTEHSSRTPLTP